MLDLDTIAKKADYALLAGSAKRVPEDPKQRRLMVGSLCLLLLALGVVLWHDRDFWFPDAPEVESDQMAESFPAAQPAPASHSRAAAKPVRAARSKPAPKHQVATTVQPPAPPDPVAPVTTTRTALPPLEVEVVAGDSHQTLRPGSSSVRVDLQPGASPQAVNVPAAAGTIETAANLTTNVSERVRMTTDASDIVAHPVRPNYPLLARQMKVQGSVILQALIGRDGIIQNLRVVSGPHILASAAQDAVRQWHFKPHLEGTEPVETEAKITVNFTISTN
jgi:periplasmic protein TonB